MPTPIPPPGSDWIDSEHNQIERLQYFCRSTPNWKVDCGCTDEGDPWCVIEDGDRMILHIARIDRTYFVAAGLTGFIWRSHSMENVVDNALAHLNAISPAQPSATAPSR